MYKILKRFFWKLPIPMELKNKVRDLFPRNNDLKESQSTSKVEIISENDYLNQYVGDILNIPNRQSEFFCDYEEHRPFKSKALIIAYYLTQFHPTEKNNLWWGKGNTEWNNVTKSVPQFIGHLQPRLPRDLGFYDLRLKDNIAEQIKIAQNYGVGAFCFYYYWFNGERALETPLNIYIENKDLDFPFSICWCNEDWTKRYSGINNEILMSVGTTEESYKKFIEDAIICFRDSRYLLIDDKVVFSVYRPSQIPNCKNIIKYWRKRVKESIGREMFLIASMESGIDIDWTRYGFDAMSQFQPASIVNSIKNINKSIEFIRPDFAGNVYDYEELVRNKLYLKSLLPNTFPAVMPSWDNTARRNNRGTIFINNSPLLYKEWLKDVIEHNTQSNLSVNIVFINAWNEWGEGAYLEPDRDYGYAYLQATYEVIKEQ